MLATVHPLPIPRPPAVAGPRGARARAVVGVLAAVGLAAAIFHAVERDKRALREIYQPDRAALYTRTLQNLETVCAGRGRFAVRDFCREQAMLALSLPECDERCSSAVRAALHGPTR